MSGHDADRWARPVRLLIGVTVLGALAGLASLAGDGDFDVAMPVILWFGVAGGVVGGIRFFLLPWGGSGDPRLGGDFDETPVYAGYAHMFGDYLRALGLWIVGSLIIGLIAAVQSGDGSAIWVFPIILGLAWSVAYGIAALGIGLIAIPIVILVRARIARRVGAPIDPWWYFLAVALMILISGVLSLVLLLTLAPQLIGVAGDDLFLALFMTDTSSLTAPQLIALWVTRVLALLMAIALIASSLLARRRMRELRGLLGGSPT